MNVIALMGCVLGLLLCFAVLNQTKPRDPEEWIRVVKERRGRGQAPGAIIYIDGEQVEQCKEVFLRREGGRVMLRTERWCGHNGSISVSDVPCQ